ncbi:cell wall hydrolase [Sphingomonas edaphi]|uniref:Cell wall hydrolase n=2 Tax=Sphingomonas edaphi TaxID=2315689 RepID=A0A418Q3P0_9SPHN|nr:cell wall hydrolase [Sphingomonas edaphi]
MFVSLRTTFLVIAALTASSVAPAKVNPAAEPLIAEGSNAIPAAVAAIPIPAEVASDLLNAPEANLPTASANAEADDDVAPGASLSEAVAQLASTEAGSRELECLAGAIYFESKSESLQGQLAVGHVIANRAASGRFPSSYCGVVYQRSQFSFVRGKSMPPIPRASRDWKEAVAIAKIVDRELRPSPVGKALFFHARRVSPGWRLTRVATLGNHVFYR